MPDLANPLSSEAAAAELDRQEANELVLVSERIHAVLADLEHVRAKAGTTHHDACWDEHVGCLAARIRRTLTATEEP